MLCALLVLEKGIGVGWGEEIAVGGWWREMGKSRSGFHGFWGKIGERTEGNGGKRVRIRV